MGVEDEDYLDKILTIAVPAYNAEWCIEKCLSSLIDERIIDDLEVIIINDGSTDRTADVVSRFVGRYSETFFLFSKENGGHGSTINTAITHANGKYFKVIDADDWVLTENLVAVIEILRERKADVVLANFHTVDMTSGNRQEFMTRGIKPGEIYSVESFASASSAAFKCLTFHGIIYLTDFYRSIGYKLPEKIFFEDQEYATSPLAKAKTILPLDIFLYQYMIGNAAQSVSDDNQIKRIKDIELVVKDVVDCFNDNADMSEGAKKLFIYKFCSIVKSYYVVALIKNTDRNAGRKDAARLRRLLADKNRRLARYTDLDYNIILLMHYLHISSHLWQRMKQIALFKLIYNSANNGDKNKDEAIT